MYVESFSYLVTVYGLLIGNTCYHHKHEFYGLTVLYLDTEALPWTIQACLRLVKCKDALNHLRANEKQKNDLCSHPISENRFVLMPIIFESLGNTLPEVCSFMFRVYKNYYSDRGESNEESTMNATRKVRFWLKNSLFDHNTVQVFCVEIFQQEKF